MATRAKKRARAKQHIIAAPMKLMNPGVAFRVKKIGPNGMDVEISIRMFNGQVCPTMQHHLVIHEILSVVLPIDITHTGPMAVGL